MELDAGFAQECIDVRAEGEVQREILFKEFRASIGHSKADAFEHTVILVKVEFQM